MSTKDLYDVGKQGVMLAHEYLSKTTGKPNRDPVGWFASEKFDGIRTIWTGRRLVSRNNKEINAPKWFTDEFPKDFALDGELTAGREEFKKTVSTVKKKVPIDSEWEQIVYRVFDVPSMNAPFEARVKKYSEIVDKQCKGKMECILMPVEQIKIKSEKQLNDLFRKLINGGAEGVMLRSPGSRYEGTRSWNLLKMKKVFDAEAKIIGYKDGQGRNTGRLGSFHVQLLKDPKVTFWVSGMDDSIRESYKETHPIGTVITFSFNDLTNNGVPRHPRYLRIFEANFVSGSKEAKSPPPRLPGKNKDIAKILKLASLRKQEIGEDFAAKALQKAVRIISKFPENIESGNQLKGTKGIGEGVIRRIDEILETGTLEELNESPELAAINELTRVAGIGPQFAKKMIARGITTVEDLEKATVDRKVKLSLQQLIGLKYFDDFQQMIPFDEIKKIKEQVLAPTINELDPNIIWELVGSHRRKKKFSSDLDLLISHPLGLNKLNQLIRSLKKRKFITESVVKGVFKFRGVYKWEGIARKIDITFVPPDTYWSALLHGTGSGRFNEEMRAFAIKKGFKLSEFGLFRRSSNKKIPVTSERDIFDKIGFKFLKPEDRD